MNYLNELHEDIINLYLPRHDEAYNKCPELFFPGLRIGWWYKEDEEYAHMYYHDPGDLESFPPYQGVVIPRYDIGDADNGFSPEDAIVIQTMYPTEQCDPEVGWIVLRRLIDDDNLVKVVRL
jgi:hypothetical protein